MQCRLFYCLPFVFLLTTWLLVQHRNPARYSYVTWVNDKYTPGGVALAHSLRSVGSTYPITFLIPPDLSQASRRTLGKLGPVVEVPPLELSPDAEGKVEEARWRQAFNKFYAWTLVSHHKVMWLDADVIVLENLDDLFLLDFEFMGALDANASTCELDTKRENKLNAGIMLITPSVDTFAEIKAFFNSEEFLSLPVLNDQVLLEKYYAEQWTRLPYPQYGAQVPHCDCNLKLNWNPFQHKVLHFTGGRMTLPKPWEPHDSIPQCAQPWYQHWSEVFEKSFP